MTKYDQKSAWKLARSIFKKRTNQVIANINGKTDTLGSLYVEKLLQSQNTHIANKYVAKKLETLERYFGQPQSFAQERSLLQNSLQPSKSPPSSATSKAPIAHPDKIIPTYKQKLKKNQRSTVAEAENIIKKTQKPTSSSTKQPTKTRKYSGKPLPIFGEQPSNLPSPEIIIPKIQQKIKKDILTPQKEQLHPPTQRELEQITALPKFIAHRLTKSQQTEPQTQTTEASARITQTANFNPIRQVVHSIGTKTKINGIIYKTKQAFKNSKLNKSIRKVGNKAKNKAKSLFKKGVGKLTKKLALKAGTILVGAATGIGLVLGAAGVVFSLGKFITKNKEIALAMGSWLMLKFAALLANTLALVGTVTGAIIGGIIGSVFGPLGAIVGASIGATIGGTIGNALFNWIQGQGGVGNLTQNAIYGSHVPAVNPITGKFGGTTRMGGAADLITGYASPTLVPAGLIGIPLFSTLGIATFITFFVMIVILTSFTVPNPMGIPTNNPIIGENLQCESNQPDSTVLWSDIQAAAAQACIPVEILAAIMQTESGAYGLTDTQYQNLSTNDWWKNVDINGENVNCYDSQYQKDSNGNLTQCGEGYCYDTCTATGLCGTGGNTNTCSNTAPPPDNECTVTSPGALPCPPDGQCSNLDVYGIMQFERSTFHGSNCLARNGINTANPASCTTGSGGTGNRCNAQNSVFAAARYIANRIGISCPYNPNNWNLARFCQAAKTYCGSCGTVENTITQEIYEANPETYPCYPYYGNNGDPNGACTGINPSTGNAEGYCDKVYRLTNCTVN